MIFISLAYGKVFHYFLMRRVTMFTSTKEKMDYCKELGFKFDEKVGWHVQVGWQAREQYTEEEFQAFMKKMGWSANLDGFHRNR